MITENLSTLKINKLTQEQYDRELAAGNIDPTALYLTPDPDTLLPLQNYISIEISNDKLYYYVHTDSDQINITGNYEALPLGWVGFLTISNPNRKEIDSSNTILESNSLNKFTLLDIAKMEYACLMMNKTANKEKL